MPSIQPNIPGTQASMPSIQPNIPGTQASMPSIQPNIPGTQSSMPSTQPNIPGAQVNMPSAQPNIPGTQASMPSIQPNIPGTQASMPSTYTYMQNTNSNFQNNEIPRYSSPKKKRKNTVMTILLSIVLIVGTVFAYIFFFYRDETKITKIKNELVGTWSGLVNKKDDEDGAVIFNITFEFNEDDTFKGTGYVKIINDQGSTKVKNNVDVTGKYIINNIGNKIKLKYNKPSAVSLYSKFSNFQITDNKLYIDGNDVYNKILTDNNDSTQSNGKGIVGKWYWYKNGEKDTTVYYIFNEDGTGQYVVNDIPINLKYEINEDKLIIELSGVNTPRELRYEIINNILRINDGLNTNSYMR